MSACLCGSVESILGAQTGDKKEGDGRGGKGTGRGREGGKYVSMTGSDKYDAHTWPSTSGRDLGSRHLGEEGAMHE